MYEVSRKNLFIGNTGKSLLNITDNVRNKITATIKIVTTAMAWYNDANVHTSVITHDLSWASAIADPKT